MAALNPSEIANANANANAEAWSRIADLRPRLRDHLEFVQQSYRGADWSLLADQFADNYFRCSEQALRFLQLLDGNHSIEAAYQQCRSGAADGPGREEVIRLIADLSNADLLQGDFPIAADAVADRSERIDQQRRRQRWLRPLAIKIPLLDPDRFLTASAAAIAPLFSSAMLLIWLLAVASAAVLAGLHWAELGQHWQTRFSDPQNLLWLWLLYPLVKILHELGHAYATKTRGGAVHEMGVMLLVFMPVPYVDSSASHRFAAKQQRMLVGAAGIMVELLLAAAALWLWSLTEPGTVHDLAFNVAVIGGVSTLLFNGNPLLRFDGYYVFSDWLEIPNLAARSNQYLGYLLKRYGLGMADSRSPVTAEGERRWFVGYGIVAGGYRLLISLFIALWISGQFFVLGVILACWALISQLFYPALRQLARLLPAAARAGKSVRLLVLVSSVALLVGGGLLLPIEHSSVAEGVVVLPEDSLIRARTDGVVVDVLAEDDRSVVAGTPLLRLEDPLLDSQLRVLLAKKSEAEAEQQQLLLEDRNRSEMLKTEVLTLEAEIADMRERLQHLSILSPSAGLLSVPALADLPGRYIHKGDLVGYVVDLSQVNARVVVEQDAIERIRSATQAIEVKLHSAPELTLPATLIRAMPKAIDQLPSRVLGSQAGGDIAVDARDEQGLQTLSRVFAVDIALPLKASGGYLGQRLSVRFVHGRENWATRIYRGLRQRLLKELLI